MRAQLTLTVVLAALLSTAATLFIAHNAIHTFSLQQATSQAKENIGVAEIVKDTNFGNNVSISSDGQMVLDSPSVGRDLGTSFGENNGYGKYPLNGDFQYVRAVQSNTSGSMVTVFQCVDQSGNYKGCHDISTTYTRPGPQGSVAVAVLDKQLCSDIFKNLQVDDASSQHAWIGESADPVGTCGTGYFGVYKAMLNPQGQFVGVLYVGEPLDAVTTFENQTALELLLLGVIVMTAGAVLALLFASAIVNALQRAARHVSTSSERIAGIAAQQSGGAAQQVWAVNAVNKALQNFQDMARDIAQRTDQLSLMGNQIISRRGEISPAQIDSILAYMTRSVRDISVASRQQASQFERMSGAMQAVIEIAEQVAGNSQQSSESAERLQLVVRQLQQLVGVSPFTRRTAVSTAIDANFLPSGGSSAGWGGQEMRVPGARERGMQQAGPGRQPAAVGAGARYAQGGAYQAAPYAASGYAGNNGGGYNGQYGMRAGNGYADNGYGGTGYSAGGMLAGGGMGVPAPATGGAAWGGARGNGAMRGMMSGGMAGGMNGAPMGSSMMPGGMSGVMSGGMRGGLAGGMGGEADWRLPPMPPLPNMPAPNIPPMGGNQMGQQGSGFGGYGAAGAPANPPSAHGDAWGAPDQGNEPRRSWTGEG
jgi:hypothetical protein